ncbi:MAG: hypothetical protein IT204_02605 [Fimbriimonadaceae bacterium]|nr:hypothetical protein [Fimbriimonadaceae bacterium]
MRELKFAPSGVRGVVGEAFTPELAVDLAAAFASFADGAPVVIGWDSRRSSQMLRAAVTAGLLAGGCEVIDLGLAPTPLVSYGVRELGGGGGISITGSHNDARWNALKFFDADGTLLNAAKGEELLDVYHAAAWRHAPDAALQPVAEAPELVERYLTHLRCVLDAEPIRQRALRVVIDTCNGACGELADRFLRDLGCQVYPINAEPTGEFAHLPAPSARNMAQLATITRHLGADLGVALNVDGDRVGFVTGAGAALSEEYSLPLAALQRLARRPGLVVTNGSTSQMIDHVAARYGQQVQRTAVGEADVIDVGLADEAVLAGEGSGGVAVLPATTTFDGLLTVGMVLEALATRETTLAALVDELPRLVMRKGEIPCPPHAVYRLLDSLRGALRGDRVDTRDGLRVEWSDAWLHVRASNTEPLLRLIVEAATAERAEQLYQTAVALPERMLAGFVARR